MLFDSIVLKMTTVDRKLNQFYVQYLEEPGVLNIAPCACSYKGRCACCKSFEECQKEVRNHLEYLTETIQETLDHINSLTPETCEF